MVHIDGLSNDTAYLANYYGQSCFTTQRDRCQKEPSRFQANHSTKVEVRCRDPAQILEFLMVDEDMEFKTTANNPSGDIEVVQSKENEVFYSYLNFLKTKRQERGHLTRCFETARQPKTT